MTHRTVDEERAKLLSYCQSRFQLLYQGILNIDLNEQKGSKFNGLTLYHLLDSAAMHVKEFFVKIVNLPKINQKA